MTTKIALHNAEFRDLHAASLGSLRSYEPGRDYPTSSIAENIHIQQYGFAVLDERVIEALRFFGPWLEVGAGCGYWSYEMTRAGIDVVATDPAQEGQQQYRVQWRSFWIPIERLNASGALARYPKRNLLTVWPDYDAAWTSQMLRDFQGDIVAYVGEGAGGCTGDDAFHQILEEQFKEIAAVDTLHFLGMKDALTIHRRIKRNERL